MSWKNSKVMGEFEKIAKDTNLLSTDWKDKDYVGNSKKETPVITRQDYYEKNDKTGYDVTKETGEDLIEEAHPAKENKPQADAQGKGGLVENQNQQQEADLEIATKMPKGTLPGVHAAIISNLVKIANELEADGKQEEAMRIDATIERLSGLPFEQSQALTKEALGFLIPLVVGLGTLGWGTNSGWFSSKRESISVDLQDLYDILITASQSKWYSSASSPSAAKAATLIRPFLGKFKTINLSTPQDAAKLKVMLDEFVPVFSQIAQLVGNLEAELGESRWYEAGQDRVTRAKAKLADVQTNIQLLEKKFNQATEVGQKTQTENAVPTKEPASLDNLLFNRGAFGKKWDKADKATAVADLEKMLDEKIKSKGLKFPKSFVGQVSNADPAKMTRIVEILEE